MSVGTPCPAGAGRPLRVTAHLRGGVCMPEGHIALDALLAWAVCQVENVPAPEAGGEVVAVEIPIEREPGGRFHLCSLSVGQVEARERQYTNRRTVAAEAQWLAGPKVRRLEVATGRGKPIRKPREVVHLADDRLDWWCIGDAGQIRALLDVVEYVGKLTGHGIGRVARWSVVEVTPWERGFPLELDGAPLRPLPRDWPGLAPDTYVRHATITYPYWHDVARRAELLACPEPML